MKSFEFITASSNDLQVALKNIKDGIIKQFGNKNFTINNIFVSQQIVNNAALVTPQNPAGSVLVFHVTALLVDQDDETVVSIPGDNGNSKKLFDQEF